MVGAPMLSFSHCCLAPDANDKSRRTIDIGRWCPCPTWRPPILKGEGLPYYSMAGPLTIKALQCRGPGLMKRPYINGRGRGPPSPIIVGDHSSFSIQSLFSLDAYYYMGGSAAKCALALL